MVERTATQSKESRVSGVSQLETRLQTGSFMCVVELRNWYDVRYCEKQKSPKTDG